MTTPPLRFAVVAALMAAPVAGAQMTPTTPIHTWTKHASAAQLTAIPHSPGTLIVRVDAAKGRSAQDALQTLLRETGGTIRWSSNLVPGMHVLDINDTVTKGIQVARDRGNDVVYVHPAYKLHASATNDPHWSALWGLRNDGSQYANPGGQVTSVQGVEGIDIRADEAWAVQPNANGVTVAVIDSGVDLAHEDLAGAIWVNQNETPGNGVDDDGNGYVDDINGWSFRFNQPTPPANDHGTHCSGTIAAVADNGVGLTGVAPGATIMPLQFLEEFGNGQSAGDTAHAMQAIEYAVAQGVRISNNSWGGGGPSPAMYDTMNAAGNAGHLFIIAAGNTGGPVEYPAAYDLDCILSVAAIRPDGQLAGFSCHGAGVDIAAPGWGIVSSVPGGYANYQGTSMAAPHVAGAAALLLARSNGAATAAQLKQALVGSVRQLDTLNGMVETGGMLDLPAALQALDQGDGGDPGNQPGGTYGLLKHDGPSPTNMTVTFQPDGNAWTMCREDGITSLPAGQDGSTLNLGDDDAAWVDFNAGFAFAGAQFDRVHVHSNGSVTLTASSANDHQGTEEAFMQAPRIAPLFTDLDPSARGSVRTQALTDRLVISWLDVPAFGQTPGNTMQLELFTDGRIRMTWLDIPAAAGAHVIGMGGNGLASQQVNLNQSTICQDEQAPAACAEDLNQDGKVGVQDLIQLLEAWGTCE